MNARVAVGTLADFCRGGDINFRFTAKSTAVEGMHGHRQVQRSRGDAYLAEYPVSEEITVGDFTLTVSGRVDGVGWDSAHHCLFLEEIKTLRVAVQDIPSAVKDSYWHQALLYAYFICLETGCERIAVRLCFYHLDEKSEELLERVIERPELGQIFVDTINRYVELLVAEQAWRAVRNQSLETLSFPYARYRDGQRDLAVSVYRTLVQGGQLVMQAPTGTGKTMGALFPAVKALGADSAARLFYLTARGATQQLAIDAISDLARQGARLRTLILTAKDKVCFSPGKPCHPDHCDYARGYYDRIHDVIQTIVTDRDHFGRADIERAARDHRVCPFELGLDLSRRCDVVIADYNYVFDPVVYLRRYFDSENRDSIALVDEAHNLVDRGRDMFSASVTKQDYLDLARQLAVARPLIARTARGVNRAITKLKRELVAAVPGEYLVTTELPAGVLAAMARFCDTAEQTLREEGAEPWREALLQVYFDSHGFSRTAEWYSSAYRLIVHGEGRELYLKLYCVDPSPQLGQAFGRLHSSVCMSATMQPADYFRQLLGTRADADWFRIPSPFPARNLSVTLAGHIDTSYRGRRDSIDELCRLIGSAVSVRPGNYLVFFPSYEYLGQAKAKFEIAFPQVELIVQARVMTDEDRQSFIERFNSGPVCGFAVMGGAFAEGIDLKGEKLIGAFIVGVGLPQTGVERDLIRDHFPDDGFAYAYQYPGLVKVLQTAGRVIRDEQDQGIICLIDCRYLARRYRALLPQEWQPEACRSTEEVLVRINEFWAKS